MQPAQAPAVPAWPAAQAARANTGQLPCPPAEARAALASW